MGVIPVYDVLREKMAGLARLQGLLEEEVLVYTEVLTPEQAIGQPERRDFPLLKGKEKMMEACLGEARGQAYTGYPGFFRGSLARVLELDLQDDFERAVFIASLNALARHAGLVQNTRHCRDRGPGDCGRQVADFLGSRYGRFRLGIVGLQPALVAACAPVFPLRVIDLDPDNINREREGVLIEDGEKAAADLVKWAQVLLVTGSTMVNGTIHFWLAAPKPVIFYGTTIAGTAALLGLQRYCPCST